MGLRGKVRTNIEFVSDSGAWYFVFDGSGFNIECPWRILSAGRIALGNCDHNQWFGLPAPIDAAQVAHELLDESPIADVRLEEKTADLTITFQNGAVLEVFNHSAGYKGWNGCAGGVQVIALGGGDVAVSDCSPT